MGKPAARLGHAEGFEQKYGDPVQRNIESYLFFDRDNPSSVASASSAPARMPGSCAPR
jgi:uncharacterized alpha-E superfamily protein